VVVVVIAWRGQGGPRGREGGVIDLPARRGAGCVPWHWRCVRAGASALYCYYCTYFALLYLSPPAVVVVESSSPLLRRGRCFQTFVSPAGTRPPVAPSFVRCLSCRI
jgi:hypothetical protein